jgi:hypothetical protein
VPSDPVDRDGSASPAGPLEDIVAEGRRIADAAVHGGVLLRLIGGVAISLHARDGVHPALARRYGDIDLVTTRDDARATRELLESLGYEPNERFNALNGSERLVFYDVPHLRQVDVFVGEFSMCHVLPITERLALDSLTVPLAELLLTKLQIVQLNSKDIRDLHALLVEHDVSEGDDDTINAALIASLLARDWGLWRTVQSSIETVIAALPESGLSASEQALVSDRLTRLADRIEAEPKSRRWRTRARVGVRVRWYQEPEEIAHRAQPEP